MKISKLVGLGVLLALGASANDVREHGGRLYVAIDEFKDAYALFTALNVRTETADQGEIKRFSAKSDQDELELTCNFDHRTSCELTYESSRHVYLTEAGKDGFFMTSAKIANELFGALNVPASTGYGSTVKTYISADAALEISCTRYESPRKTSCMIEVIGKKR